MVSGNQWHHHDSRGDQLCFIHHAGPDHHDKLLGQGHQPGESHRSEFDLRNRHGAPARSHRHPTRLNSDQQRPNHDALRGCQWFCSAELPVVSGGQRCDHDSRGNQLRLLHHPRADCHDKLLGQSHQLVESYRRGLGSGGCHGAPARGHRHPAGFNVDQQRPNHDALRGR